MDHFSIYSPCVHVCMSHSVVKGGEYNLKVIDDGNLVSSGLRPPE